MVISPKMLQIMLGWGEHEAAIIQELGEGQSKAVLCGCSWL